MRIGKAIFAIAMLGGFCMSVAYYLNPMAFLELAMAQNSAVMALIELRFQDVGTELWAIDAHWLFWWFAGLGHLVFAAALGAVFTDFIEIGDAQPDSAVDEWERENL